MENRIDGTDKNQIYSREDRKLELMYVKLRGALTKKTKSAALQYDKHASSVKLQQIADNDLKITNVHAFA